MSTLFAWWLSDTERFLQLREQLEVTLSFMDSLHNSDPYAFIATLALLCPSGHFLHHFSYSTLMLYNPYSVSGYMPLARDTPRIYNLYGGAGSSASPPLRSPVSLRAAEVVHYCRQIASAHLVQSHIRRVRARRETLPLPVGGANWPTATTIVLAQQLHLWRKSCRASHCLPLLLCPTVPLPLCLYSSCKWSPFGKGARAIHLPQPLGLRKQWRLYL